MEELNSGNLLTETASIWPCEGRNVKHSVDISIPNRAMEVISSYYINIYRVLLLLNLGFTVILALSLLLYFQFKIDWMESDLSELKRELRTLQSTENYNFKRITKRSTDNELENTEQQLSRNATALGMAAVQFHGALPIQHVRNKGRIGPWTLAGRYTNFIDLKEGNTEFQIKNRGLYFLHAQIFYLTSELSNTYEIVKYKENQERKQHKTLAVCSSLATDKKSEFMSRPSVNEVSCYTGITTYLDENDRLYLNQVEQNRCINFNQAYSHFGIIQISR